MENYNNPIIETTRQAEIDGNLIGVRLWGNRHDISTLYLETYINNKLHKKIRSKHKYVNTMFGNLIEKGYKIKIKGLTAMGRHDLNSLIYTTINDFSGMWWGYWE